MKDIVEVARGWLFLKAESEEKKGKFWPVADLSLSLKRENFPLWRKWGVTATTRGDYHFEDENFRKLEDAVDYFQGLVAKHDLELVEVKGVVPIRLQAWVKERMKSSEDETPDES